jgi:hypothetical protein
MFAPTFGPSFLVIGSSVMRRFAFASACLAFTACQKEPVSDQIPAAASQTAASGASATTVSDVEGWETRQTAYAFLGAVAPDFKAMKLGGGEISQKDLRGHWTILGFWSAPNEGEAKEEMRYIGALNSAADQDQDLDFLSVYTGGADDFDIQKWSAGSSAWPTLLDGGKLAGVFSIERVPAYLLIGPDLTIEGYRGALAKTPDDGIKPVIRGVAEIRKQIAAPE